MKLLCGNMSIRLSVTLTVNEALIFEQIILSFIIIFSRQEYEDVKERDDFKLVFEHMPERETWWKEVMIYIFLLIVP